MMPAMMNPTAPSAIFSLPPKFQLPVTPPETPDATLPGAPVGFLDLPSELQIHTLGFLQDLHTLKCVLYNNEVLQSVRPFIKVCATGSKTTPWFFSGFKEGKKSPAPGDLWKSERREDPHIYIVFCQRDKVNTAKCVQFIEKFRGLRAFIELHDPWALAPRSPEEDIFHIAEFIGKLDISACTIFGDQNIDFCSPVEHYESLEILLNKWPSNITWSTPRLLQRGPDQGPVYRASEPLPFVGLFDTLSIYTWSKKQIEEGGIEKLMPLMRAAKSVAMKVAPDFALLDEFRIRLPELITKNTYFHLSEDGEYTMLYETSVEYVGIKLLAAESAVELHNASLVKNVLIKSDAGAELTLSMLPQPSQDGYEEPFTAPRIEGLYCMGVRSLHLKGISIFPSLHDVHFDQLLSLTLTSDDVFAVDSFGQIDYETVDQFASICSRLQELTVDHDCWELVTMLPRDTFINLSSLTLTETGPDLKREDLTTWWNSDVVDGPVDFSGVSRLVVDLRRITPTTLSGLFGALRFGKNLKYLEIHTCDGNSPDTSMLCGWFPRVADLKIFVDNRCRWSKRVEKAVPSKLMFIGQPFRTTAFSHLVFLHHHLTKQLKNGFKMFDFPKLESMEIVVPDRSTYKNFKLSCEKMPNLQNLAIGGTVKEAGPNFYKKETNPQLTVSNIPHAKTLVVVGMFRSVTVSDCRELETVISIAPLSRLQIQDASLPKARSLRVCYTSQDSASACTGFRVPSTCTVDDLDFFELLREDDGLITVEQPLVEFGILHSRQHCEKTNAVWL